MIRLALTLIWLWLPGLSSAVEPPDGVRLTPLAEAATELNGFRIGAYPQASEFGPAYRRPDGLIEVTPTNKGHHVSQHFRLEQFLCKQPGGWPKYIALSKALLARLENIVGWLDSAGFDGSKLVIMSGYRTPLYNAGLGNVPRSRHLYGDAADIYLDADGDGLMDDLNGDGHLDVHDAVWLAKLIDSKGGADEGGLAAYPPTTAHGAFVHVDTRGEAARWGFPLENELP